MLVSAASSALEQAADHQCGELQARNADVDMCALRPDVCAQQDGRHLLAQSHGWDTTVGCAAFPRCARLLSAADVFGFGPSCETNRAAL